MANPCNKCLKPIGEEDKIASCDCCKAIFHLSEKCTGLCASEIRTITIQKRLMLYFCEDCRASFKQVPLLIQKITILQKQVQELRNEVQNLKEKENQGYDSFIQEYEERKLRANNIMVYNIPESEANTVQDKIAYDREVVVNILAPVPVVGVIKKVLRIGKVGRRPRPIKLVMDSQEAALNILKNKNKIQQPQAKFSSDLTVNQRNHLKELRRELDERTAQGESDITIKYVYGVPKIVMKSAKN